MTSNSNDNPLREGLRTERTASPCIVVIFGASGDLTKRKLVPALFRLSQERLLPAEFAIVGISRSPLSDDEFRDRMKEALSKYADVKRLDEEVWNNFAQGIHYLPGDLGDPHTYQQLSELLDKIDHERGTGGNRVFYLSTAPAQYSEAIHQLGAAGLSKTAGSSLHEGHHREAVWHGSRNGEATQPRSGASLRGRPGLSYRPLSWKRDGPESAIFRFANGIFEPIWNRQYIDHVQITNAESIGVEGRGAYYETAGVTRDMIQNHVFQVLSLVAMEPPPSLSANAVRDEKIKAMQAVRPIKYDQIDQFALRGQYGPGSVSGHAVPGYREEPGVAPDSRTETFAVLKLLFDNWRWAGVPFYIRSGKRMPKRVTKLRFTSKKPAPLV
jgi:glucose-6-phosphate 1-dehydrogenase